MKSMTPEQLKNLKDEIREYIKEHVGHLRDDFKNYQDEDREWKKRAEKSVVFFENITVVKRFLMWSFGIISAIGGLLIMAKDVLHK